MSNNILFPGSEEDWGDVWEHVSYLNWSYDYTLEYHSPTPFQVPSSPTIDFVCGIGTAPVPPNDPDVNNSTITAVPSRNGIFIQWRYPNLYPELVSFTEVYRSTSNDFGGAGVIGRNSADNFTDELEEEQKGTRFYYWVRHVSIHGTWGDPIGPASAVWDGSIDDILEHLNNLIDASHLDQHLRERIGRITDISSGLDAADEARLFGDSILTGMVQEIASDLAAIDTRVDTAITEIQTDTHAIAAKIELVLAKFDENIAAVLDETYALAEADSVAAGRITTVEGALTDPDTGELFVVAVQEQKIVELGQQYTDHEGKLQDLLAQWSIKVDVDGFVSGIGLSSSEDSSMFIVNSNIFAIGPPTDTTDEFLYDDNGNLLIDGYARPFVVEQKFIDGAWVNTIGMDANVYIRNGTVKNAQIGEFIQSDDWNYTNDDDFVGWRIDKSGDAFFDNLTAKGNIQARTIEAGAVNIIDTLMLRGNAVTIPEGISFFSGIDLLNTSEILRLNVFWGDPDTRPQAFLVNALYELKGVNSNGDVAGHSGCDIKLRGIWSRESNSPINSVHAHFSQSLWEGFGGTVNGIWHVVPPGSPSVRYTGVALIIEGTVRDDRNNGRKVGQAAITALGSKR